MGKVMSVTQTTTMTDLETLLSWRKKTDPLDESNSPVSGGALIVNQGKAYAYPVGFLSDSDFDPNQQAGPHNGPVDYMDQWDLYRLITEPMTEPLLLLG